MALSNLVAVFVDAFRLSEIVVSKDTDFKNLPENCLPNSALPKRAMSRGTLLGKHSHGTSNGVNVHIYVRDGKFLARGRHKGKMFGETLGNNDATAECKLIELLGKFNRGAFVRPSEAKSRPLNETYVARITLRELCNEFLVDKRRLLGRKTAQDYQSRLTHALDFAETETSCRSWPLARDIDRDFAIQYRIFLINRQVARNGRPNSETKRMSLGHVRNCLEALRAALVWGMRADVRKLPLDFANPINKEIIIPPPAKDPLRKPTFPMERRIELINCMDKWEVLHLSFSMVLPLRFDEVAGILVSDIDFENHTVQIGDRFGESDFTKNRVNVAMPLPFELLGLARVCYADRDEGPLFQSRAVWECRRKPEIVAESREHLARIYDNLLNTTTKNTILAPADRKAEFRRMLSRMGGVTADQISKELKRVMRRIGGNERPYDLRGSITEDMKAANVNWLELHYLTTHRIDHILNQYVGLTPPKEMGKYFISCQSLLAAILQRAHELGIRAEQSSTFLVNPNRKAG